MSEYDIESNLVITECFYCREMTECIKDPDDRYCCRVCNAHELKIFGDDRDLW